MQTFYPQRIWYQTAFLLLACIPLILMAGQFDARVLNDIPLWIKPLKFHVSTALHLITFAVLIRFLSDKSQNAKWLGAVALISAAATIVEVIMIDFQAARGVHSHFNFSSQFNGSLYAMMGVCALLLSAPALILGIRFIFEPVSERLPPGLKLGTIAGLLAGFVLTLGIAGYMSSMHMSHWVNAPETDLGGAPVFGWTRQGGDLRVPHFFATHLMQILPLAGYLLDKWFSDNTGKIKLGVCGISLVGIAVTIGTFLQAMAGKPFI